MTLLTRPRTFTVRVGMNALVCQVTPDGMLRLREPRKRTWFDIPLARCYNLAAQAAATEIIERRKRR